MRAFATVGFAHGVPRVRRSRAANGMHGALTAGAQQVKGLLSLRVLPARVALFVWRANRHARRAGDQFSLVSAARPAEMATLLSLARGRKSVVELGTGTAWSAIVLALDDRMRKVVTYDPCVRPEREAYLNLVGRSVRARIDLREEPDSRGPRSGEPPVEMLFIDSAHERGAVMDAFRAWRHALGAGALVAFHDYGHPHYPGVREAILDLELSGEQRGGLFVWRAPP